CRPAAEPSRRKYRWARYSVPNGTFVTSKASRETSEVGRCVTPTSRAPPGACRRSPRLVFPGSRRQQPVSSPSDAHDRTVMGRGGGWLAGGGSGAGGVVAGRPVGWVGGRRARGGVGGVVAGRRGGAGRRPPTHPGTAPGTPPLIMLTPFT